MITRTAKDFLLLLGFFVVGLLVYRDGLHIPYYADDYQRVFTNPAHALTTSFSVANFYDHSYRPLETAVLAFIQMHWDWDTFPFRLLNVLLHAGGALLVFKSLRFWKLGYVASLISACFVIVSQASAAAVLGNDTQSQISGALFSALSLWMLYRYLSSPPKYHWKYVTSVLSFFLALLSKETSSGLCIAVFLLVTIFISDSVTVGKAKRVVVLVLPYFLLALLYWVLRVVAGGASPSIGTEKLSLGFGMNVPMNIGLFVFQSVLPVSSMLMFKAWLLKDWVLTLSILCFTTMFAGVLCYGIFKTAPRSVLVGVGIAIGCSWIPAVLLNHTGELYVYNSILYIGVLIGFGIEFYVRSGSERRNLSLSWFAAAILIGGIITNVIGTNEKASSMKVQGDRAAIFLPQLVRLARIMPPNGWMYLRNPKDTSFEYSMFALHGFRVSTLADSLVRFSARRPDVHVYAGDSTSCDSLSHVYPGIDFTYDPKSYTIFPMQQGN